MGVAGGLYGKSKDDENAARERAERDALFNQNIDTSWANDPSKFQVGGTEAGQAVQSMAKYNPWTALAQQKSNLQTGADIDNSQQAAAGQAMSAQSALAQGMGGLSSGNALSLQKSAMRNQQFGRQATLRDAAQRNAGISTSGEEMRQRNVGSWAQMQQQDQQRALDMQMKRSEIDAANLASRRQMYMANKED
jgi:hypothetical protein